MSSIVPTAQLERDGFLLIPNAIPVAQISRWREIATALEAEALARHAQGIRVPGACVVDDPVGPRLMRWNDLLGVQTDALLDLLATPAILKIARDLCGPGAVPLHADLLFKHQHPHPVTLWHQDAKHPRSFPYLNVAIYLDDADAGDGCLRYVPGTQHAVQDIATLSSTYGWEIPNTVEQPARAGDVLVQDIMVLHGSPPKRTPNPRRTLYVEFRPIAGIVESGVQSARWAESRRRWMALVVRRSAHGDWPEEWRAALPQDLGSDAEEAAAIVALNEPPIPAIYCPHPVSTADYPVPRDLR